MLPDEIKVNFTIRPKLLLVSPLAVLALFGLFFLPWGDESAPSWVQAIGSVVAIIAAVWISNRQARQEALERQRQNYRYMFRGFQVASNAIATLSNVLEDIQEGKLGEGNVSYFRAVLGASDTELSAFNFRDMVDLGFARSWADVSRHVTLVRSRIDSYASTPEMIPRAMDVPRALEVVNGLLADLQNHLLEHSMRVGKEVYQDMHL
jgi:type II secretory pathway pseudopilin PulG